MSQRDNEQPSDPDADAMLRIKAPSPRQLRHVVHTLLLEWTSDIAISPPGAFVDFRATPTGAPGLPHDRRFRLFTRRAAADGLDQPREEARAVGLDPAAVLHPTGRRR